MWAKEKNFELLHTYFRCFANLYGVISINDAWRIFKSYEGARKVKKADFIGFSGIAQREAGHNYSIFELKEIYSDEETDDPCERLLVNNELILYGYHRFILVQCTVDRQDNKPLYFPDKQIFMTFEEDRFYLTSAGKKMKDFVEGLKTNGVARDFHGKPDGEITDINGVKVKGKRLRDFVFFTRFEVFDFDYYKSESTRQKLREKYSITASEKVLHKIKEYIMVGRVYDNNSIIDEIKSIGDFLKEDFGVALTKKQYEIFIDLFTKLNNESNLWLNCGWRPVDLYASSPKKMPKYVSVGPNMRKLFETGEMDIDEFRKNLKDLGIILCDD